MAIGGSGRALAVEVGQRSEVEFAEQVSLPTRPNAGPHRADIGGGEHREHLQHLRRTDIDGKPHQQTRVIDIAAECQMGHGQMPVNEKFHNPRLILREHQARRHIPGHTGSELTVILHKSLPEIVNQQRHKQRPLPSDLAPDGGQPALLVAQSHRLLHRHKAVLVDGVFVIVVELQEVPGMAEFGNDPFQQPHLMEPPQRLGQPLRPLKQSQKSSPGFVFQGTRGSGRTLHSIAIDRTGRSPHSLPGGMVDRFAIHLRQLHQPQAMGQTARHTIPSLWQGTDGLRPH